MTKLLIFISAICLGACSSAATAPIQCGKFTEVDRESSQDSMEQFADDIVSQAAALEAELSATPSAVGFWGSIKVKFPGTTVYDVAVRLRQLRRSVALQVAREQAFVGDGTPLVDPSKEWACKMLADSVASLDRRQSAEQLLDHLRYIQKRFGENYPFR